MMMPSIIIVRCRILKVGNFKRSQANNDYLNAINLYRFCNVTMYLLTFSLICGVTPTCLSYSLQTHLDPTEKRLCIYRPILISFTLERAESTKRTQVDKCFKESEHKNDMGLLYSQTNAVQGAIINFRKLLMVIFSTLKFSY